MKLPSELWLEIFSYLEKRAIDSLSSINSSLYTTGKEHKKKNSWSFENLGGCYYNNISLTNVEVVYLSIITDCDGIYCYEDRILFADKKSMYTCAAIYATEYVTKTGKNIVLRCSDQPYILEILKKFSKVVSPLIKIKVKTNSLCKITKEGSKILLDYYYNCGSYTVTKDEITPFWFKSYQIISDIQSTFDLALKELGEEKTIIISAEIWLSSLDNVHNCTVMENFEESTMNEFENYVFIGEVHTSVKYWHRLCMRQPKIKKIACLSFTPNIFLPEGIVERVSPYNCNYYKYGSCYGILHIDNLQGKLQFLEHWVLIDPSQRAKDLPVFASLPSLKYEIPNKRKLQETLYKHKKGINNPKKYYTTSQLKQMLTNKGLSTNGNRQKLIEMLLK